MENPQIENLELKVGSKLFPVKAHGEYQRRLLEQAEKLINDKLEHYKNKYNITDEPLLIAMICMDLSTDLIDLQQKQTTMEVELEDMVNSLSQAMQLTNHHKIVNEGVV